MNDEGSIHFNSIILPKLSYLCLFLDFVENIFILLLFICFRKSILFFEIKKETSVSMLFN